MQARPLVGAVLAICALGALGALASRNYGRPVWVPVYRKFAGTRTVAQVVEDYGATAGQRLRRRFGAVGVVFPPEEVTLVALKEERQMEVWARGLSGWELIHVYAILGASGGPGPKLREGDRQVPEGVYSIESLNPNSSFHLSLKIDYPSAYDRRQAASDGRTTLGGDIFIHGSDRSIGCLAMGDEAIEELFLLVAQVTPARTHVVIAPRDLRRKAPPRSDLGWVATLYGDLRATLTQYRRSP
jgi:hypothetical protein